MRYGCEWIFIPIQSVEQGSVSRDNLYPQLEDLLCSEGEVYLTQGPLCSGGKWAEGGGGKPMLTLAEGTRPQGSVVLLISSIWRNIAARKADPAVQQGPNKCTHVTETSSLLLLCHNKTFFFLPCFTLLWFDCTAVSSAIHLEVAVFYKNAWLPRHIRLRQASNCLIDRFINIHVYLNLWSTRTWQNLFSTETAPCFV